MSFEFNKRYLPTLFYFTNPLKGTKHMQNLSQDKTLYELGSKWEGLTTLYSAYQCVDKFNPLVIRINSEEGNADALNIFDTYKDAINDNIAEAANNLAILYHGQEKYDLCESYFKKAIAGNSYYAQQNLATYYNTEQMWDKFIEASLASAKTYNPFALYNLAITYHFGLHHPCDLTKAISLYKTILDLTYDDIRYNIEPTENEKGVLYTIQNKVAQNLSLLSEEGLIETEIIKSYPLVKWQIIYMRYLNQLKIDLPQNEHSLSSEFSFLMKRCMFKNDYAYLDEMLEDNAILSIHDEQEIFGKEEIIKYIDDWTRKAKRAPNKTYISIVHHRKQNIYALNLETESCPTKEMIGVFKNNKIREIILIEKTKFKNNAINYL